MSSTARGRESADRRRGVAAALTGVVAFALALAYIAPFLLYGVNVPDEGALLYGFERIAEGREPYTEVHLGYTPAAYYLHAALQGAFSQSIVPGRVVLAVANAGAVGLLAGLLHPLAGVVPAVLGGLLYVAAMPVHPGYFASFNVPYPAWYGVLLFLAGLYAARSHFVRPRVGAAFAAGALAAVGFAFKPNVGALQLACAMLLVLASLAPASGSGDSSLRDAAARGGRLLATLWWWAAWAAVLAGLLAIFGFPPAAREMRVLLLPAFAAALLVVRVSRRHGVAADFRTTAVHTSAVVAGFAVVTAPWVGWFALRLPADVLLEKVLFVGSSFTWLFYRPHPPSLAGALALVAAYVLASWGARRVPERRRPAVFLGGAVALAAAAAAFAAASPMIEGLERAVMVPFEHRWAYALAIAAAWLLVGETWRRAGRTEASRAQSSAPLSSGSRARLDDIATLVTLAVGAPLLYLHVYPRTDYMHWVTSAPLALAGAVVLSRLLADRWVAHAGVVVRAAAAAAVLAPLALVGSLRAGTALSAVLEVDGGRVARAPSIALDADRAPVWTNIGRAPSYGALAQVVDLVRRHSSPDDVVATFPALDMVSFLADRDSPYLDGYWFPGWRGHVDEAFAIAAMERKPPRLVVLDTSPQTYFANAPIYFFLLMDWFETNYRMFARVGPYAVMARREEAGLPAEVTDGLEPARDEPLRRHVSAKLAGGSAAALVRALEEVSDDFVEGHRPELTSLLRHEHAAVRDAAVRALRWAGDGRTALALAQAAIEGTDAEPASAADERWRRLALRLAAAWVDEAAVPIWLAHVDDPDLLAADAARTALANQADRAFYASFWPPGATSFTEAPPVRLTGMQRLRARQWLRDRNIDPRLKRFAVAYAAETGGLEELLRLAYGDCPIPSARVIVRHEREKKTRVTPERADEEEAPDTWREVRCEPERVFERLGGAIAAFSQFDEPHLRLLLELARYDADPVVARLAIGYLAYNGLVVPHAVLVSGADEARADVLLGHQLRDSRNERLRSRLLWLGSIRGGSRVVAEALDVVGGSDGESSLAALWTVLRKGSPADLARLASLVTASSQRARALYDIAPQKEERGTASTDERIGG